MDDDVGTLKYLDYSFGFLLSNFDSWLTMNWFMALQKALRAVFGDSPWVVSAPSLIAGIAVVPVSIVLAGRFLGRRHALLVGLLVALNPFLVQYSASIRSYMALVCFGLLSILAAYRWIDARNWRRGWWCALWSFLAVLVHPNAVYTLGFVGILFATAVWRDRRGIASFFAPLTVAGILSLLAYAAVYADMADFQKSWTQPAPTDWAYLPEVARRWFGSGWRCVPALVLAALGAVWALANDRRVAMLSLALLVPMCLASAMGVSHLPGTFARFLVAALPVVILLAVQGIAVVAGYRRFAEPLLLIVLLASWSPGLMNVFKEQNRKPYKEVAAHLESLDPGENEVFCLDGDTRRSLRTYLGRDPFTPLPGWATRTGAGEGRLIVVVEGPPLVTDAENLRIGILQVVVYRGTGGAVLERLLADIEATVGTRVPSGTLVDHAMTVIEILGALGREEGLLRWTAFYYECLMRTSRIRDLPPQQIRKRRSLSGHPFLRQLLTPAAGSGR